MISSALFMGVLGISATFLPQEILDHLSLPNTDIATMIIQVAGALYLGFAILNWTARANIIGGIYSRPVALGNFLHFVVVSLTFLKALYPDPVHPIIMITALLYGIFALLFGYILFTHPLKTDTPSQ